MKNYFAEKLTVNDTNIDFSYQAPIYEILKMIEATTFNHANLIGLDHETMDKQSNAFWIVTKIKLMLISPSFCVKIFELKLPLAISKYFSST